MRRIAMRRMHKWWQLLLMTTIPRQILHGQYKKQSELLWLALGKYWTMKSKLQLTINLVMTRHIFVNYSRSFWLSVNFWWWYIVVNKRTNIDTNTNNVNGNATMCNVNQLESIQMNEKSELTLDNHGVMQDELT